MQIKTDDLECGGVIRLLEEHLVDMYATSPPENVHALKPDELKNPAIQFFSAWDSENLMGCVAIKRLDRSHAELKSMRTATNARNKGVASALLQHVLSYCQSHRYERVSLETGSMAFFKPARSLYEKFGFEYCGPFSHYELDPHSQFMTLELT
jgi:putative acetyltransferase